MTTIPDLLEFGADDDIAVRAVDERPLSYGDLRALVSRSSEQLNTLGIGRNDRVAIVMPNGPHMVTAFVCIASAATTAPMMPIFKSARLLIVPRRFSEFGAQPTIRSRYRFKRKPQCP